MIQPYPFGNFFNFRRNFYHPSFHNSINGNLARSPNSDFPKVSSSHTSNFQPKPLQELPKDKKTEKKDTCNSNKDEKPVFEIFRLTFI